MLSADLALKDNPAIPAAAAILLDRDSQEDDIKGIQSEYYRIKIFTEEGRKYVNLEIPYFEKLDEVRDIRARTVRPDGTSLEFHGEILDKAHRQVKAVLKSPTGYLIDGSYSYPTVHWTLQHELFTRPARFSVR